jgi:hypothetical protein
VPDESSIETIRAAVEAIVPTTDGQPGGVELNAHRHVVELIELALPGFVDLAAMLLNAYSPDVRQGAASFTELTLEERGLVLRAMSQEDNPDLRDLLDALMVFSYGAVYSEWSGYERATGKLVAPASWKEIGFHGPVAGHPAYRQGI